jgi:hypothetical protein
MIEIKQSTATTALVFELRNDSDAPVTGATPVVTLSKNGNTFAAPAGAVSEVGNGLYNVAPNSADTDTLGILALHATAAGANAASMAYAIVANIESDSLAAIVALNNITTAQIRAELAVELARIDAAISSRNATAPDNAGIAAIKAKTDNLPASPAATGDIPSISEIIGAAGGLTTETVAALEAAEQILLASAYVPGSAPILPLPAPAGEDYSTVYAYTQDITGEIRAGIPIRFALVTVPAKGSRILETAEKTATTDANGLASIPLQRGLTYRVTSKELGLQLTITPTTETLNLADLLP